MQKLIFLWGLFLITTAKLTAQATFPVNDVASPKEQCYAFTNATIVKDAATKLQNAILIIRQGKIEAVGTAVVIPKDAVIIDCKGKYIYPSFIDIFSDYGITPAERQTRAFDFRAPAQLSSNTKGAFNWNQAVHPETDGAHLFAVDDAKAKPLRDLGFGTVQTLLKDGIVRGTGVVVTLANENENLVIVKQRSSANYSLNKGSSTQSYPGSLMGSIALLRQTYLDAAWYKSQPAHEGTNLSLQAFNEEQSLPQLFEGGDKWTDIQGDRVGDEFLAVRDDSDVVLKACGFASELLDAGRDFIGADFIRTIAKGDVRALFCEALRDSEANALAAASDGDDFFYETISHDTLSHQSG